MIRKAFMMKLKPGQQAEYERRHNPIWPALELLLRDQGVWSYSIFLNRETDQLFAYAEIESEELWEEIAQEEVCQRWWAHMQEIMVTNDDSSPTSTNLDEVFHIE
jgi:L-rhamnose mutarotase